MAASRNLSLLNSIINIILVFFLAISLSLILRPSPTQSAPNVAIDVTTTADEWNSGANCSLREAVEAANTDSAFGGCGPGSGTDTIYVPDGIYTLSRLGAGDDTNEFGDLDINSDIDFIGKSETNTIIDGNSTDRVFHIISGDVLISIMIIQNGEAPDGVDGTTPGGSGSNGSNATGGKSGGGIYNDGDLTLTHVTIKGNSAGNGGRGGNGANGANGSSGGGTGGTAGHGGNGGGGGHSGAIHNAGGSSLKIQYSTIIQNRAGNGGSGGNGGEGGQGGEGEPTNGQTDGGNGGSGGIGGHAGLGGYGGAIYNQGTLTIEKSIVGGDSGLHNASGMGGRGGTGGQGGQGGVGTKQWGPSSNPDNYAGDGGEGGTGGQGGSSGASGEGGAIFQSSGTAAMISETQIIKNLAGAGMTGGAGGLGGTGGTGGVNDSDDCGPSGDGGNGGAGGIGFNGALPGHGGGISSWQELEIHNSSISDNQTGVGGRGGNGGNGGIPGSPGETTSGCTSGSPGTQGIGGSAGDGLPGGLGGGIYQYKLSGATVDPTLFASGVTISGNIAGDGGGGGNGGTGSGDGNRGAGGKAGQGGGLYVEDGVAKMNNSTISGNRADRTPGSAGSGSGSPIDGGIGLGGGINSYNTSGPEDLKLYNVTVAGNVAGAAGAYYGALTASHTIFAGNQGMGTSDSDCWSTSSKYLVSEDYLLVETKVSCTILGTTTNNIYNQPAGISILSDNGGPTQTHALLKTSPAVDGGAAVCTDSEGSAFTTDQRGSVRPADFTGLGTAHCDIGAYELPLNVYLPLVLR